MSYLFYLDGQVRDLFDECADSTKGRERAKCKRCGVVVATFNQSVTSIRKHLQKHVRLDFLESDQASPRPQPPAFCLTKRVKQWIVAVLITVLNIPFWVLSHPAFRVIFWLANLGTINSEIARRSTDAESETLVERLKKDIREIRRQGAVFTLIADEWSWRRKRFIGVTLESSLLLPSLGSNLLDLMVRFHETATAEVLRDSIKDALAILDLQLKDISGLTTDAAMTKLGELISIELKNQPFSHQTCYAHAINVAVQKTLNGKIPSSLEDESEQCSTLSCAGEADDSGEEILI